MSLIGLGGGERGGAFDREEVREGKEGPDPKRSLRCEARLASI